MSDWDFPDFSEDVDVDWGSLPDSGDKKYKRVTIRMPDGTTKEVVVEQGLNPRLIPPPGGKMDEPSDDVAGIRPPPTIDDKIREQDTFWGKLKVAGSFALDPVGTVYGPEAHRKVVEDLVGEGETPLGVGLRTVAEKGLQLASSPLTGYFGVPGVATSTLGRVAALGFGGMAAKGGGEQLGEALSMAEDQNLGWDDPEVVRRLVSGGIDVGTAPLALAGALHGTPMARVKEVGGRIPGMNTPVSEIPGILGREAVDFAEFANPMREGPLGREAGVLEFGKKPEPVAPVEPDMVEVFRSGDGSFFTTNAERAASYPGMMTKVRVPREVFEAGRAEAAKLGQPTPQDTVLPDEWVRQAAEVEKPDVSITGAELAPDERASLFAELGIEETPPAGPVEPLVPKGAAPQAAGPRTFRTPEEEGAFLMDILNSDRPMSEKMMAQLRLEEITNPDIPPAEVVDQMNARDLPQILAEEGGPPPVRETVRPANVIPPEGVTVQKVPPAAEANVRNLNDVIDAMYGKGARVKAAQVKEARGVYEELTKTAKGDTPTTAELQAVLEKRKAPLEKVTEVPPKEQAPPTVEEKPPSAPPKVLQEQLDKAPRELTYEQFKEETRGWADEMLQDRPPEEVETALKESYDRGIDPTKSDDLTSLSDYMDAYDATGKRTEPGDVPSFRPTKPKAEVKPTVPPKEKPLSEMTPEEMEAEAVAAEGKMREGKPAPDHERAATLRRLAEQKRTKAARDAQIEATRQASAEATKAIPVEEKPAPPKTPETLGPVEPVSKAYGEPIGPKRPRGRPTKPVEVNPLEAKIPKSTRPGRVNPVEVFTGEAKEPGPVSPLEKTPAKRATAEVDTVSQKIETETGQSPNKPPADLSTPEGKKFVKSVAKNMGITEDKAAAMVGGQSVQKGSSAGAATGTPAPPGKTVLGAGKTVRGPSGGGPPGAQPPAPPPTPRLPKVKGKRPTLDLIEWMRQRKAGTVGQELTRRKFEKLPQGVQAQVDFESGKLALPEVRKWLDAQHRKMRKAGVDVGYVENYLTHLWEESPQRVRQVLGKSLGLKPGIAMTRSIPTLAEGISKGLTPKFKNMSDVLAWYDHSVNKAIADRGFFEWMRDQKQIKVAGKAPHGWVTLDPDRFPIRRWKGNTVQFKAPPELATKINNYLYDPSVDPRAFVQGLSKVARFSSFLKNIRLAAGVPFTKLNMHSFSVMAHHVLSTPTIKGAIPNIPRMIGRGLKDFAEMADPRLHRWTNQELGRAKLMQKYGPLTLSTEDHVFAPAIRGSLASRVKGAKNIPSAFKTIIDRMFEEPLFQSHLPKMKLNVAWELQKQYRKEGMGRKQAMEAAGEVTNNLFGGLNLDEMARDKIGQELARVLVLAPDWLESNLRTVKGIAKSPLGRTPKEKTYRDFMVNLTGTYVAGTLLQKALTGKWMHENNPGNQFSIYLGKNPDNGKDRYVKPYGAGLAGVRIIYDTAESVARREDISKVGSLIRGRMAIPAGVGSSFIFNKGPFGEPVIKEGDTFGGQLADVGALAASQVTPQYVMGPVAALRGEISPELGLAQSIEFPYTEVRHRNPEERRRRASRRKKRKGL